MESGAHRLVLIEDDPVIAAATVRGLRQFGFEVELACDGRTGLAKASAPGVDLVILDLMVPELDGTDVLVALRSRSAAPVIVVSARTELQTRTNVFALGAVDYLPKPFFVEELAARIRARLGAREPPLDAPATFGPLAIDHARRDCSVDGRLLGLTPTEFAIIAHLARRPDRVVERTDLVSVLSDFGESGGARNIDAHVARLRKKLGTASRVVATVWGYGYRFAPDYLKAAP